MAPRPKLGQLLIEAGLIDHSQLETALSDQVQWQRPLGVTLVKLGMVGEDDILDVLSRQLDRPQLDVEGKRVADSVLELVPYEVALARRCLPLAILKKEPVDELLLGITDPTDLELMDDIGFRTGMQVQPILVADGKLEEAINLNYRPRATHHGLPLITPEQVLRPGQAKRAPARAGQPEQAAAPKPEQEPELVLDEEVEPAERGAQKVAPTAPPERRPRGNSSLDGDMLRALIDLLVAKGIIDPDELLDWLESREKRGAS